MLTRRKFLLQASAIAGFAVSGAPIWARPDLPTLRAEDFGMVAGSADVGPALKLACEALARAGGGRLLLPTGRFHIGARSGVAVWFKGTPVVHIVGADTTLTFEGLCRPFEIQGAQVVAVSGMTIDWVRPPFSQGDVSAISRDRLSVEIALDKITPMDGWTQIEAIGGYDRDTGLLSRKRIDMYGAVSHVEPLSSDRVRLTMSRTLDAAAGQTLVLRHALFEAHAFVFAKCAAVTIEDVAVNAAPGMGFVFGECGDVSLLRCAVAPPAGTDRLMSVVADAAHLSDCSGRQRLEKCSFAQMGDDGVNVRKAYWRVVSLIDQNSVLVAKRGNVRFLDEETPVADEPFNFVSGANLEVLGTASVRGTRADSGMREILTFTSIIPSGTQVGDFIIRSNNDSLEVIACKFLGNRARGILAHHNARITKCEFRDQSLQGILLAADLQWQEGPSVENVTIDDNVFDGVGRWRGCEGAILIDGIVIDSRGQFVSTNARPNRNVQITENQFRNKNVENIVMRGMLP